MCTVIIHVGETASDPIRLLAIRDEDPARAWDPLGAWWPDSHPGAVGVRDARAGGAWLAADPAALRLAVLLNRLDLSERSDDGLVSRGSVVLDSIAGRAPDAAPSTRGFNLVDVQPGRARVTMWDGLTSRVVELAPGTHMIAHDDVDDPATARIVHWLPEFDAHAPARDTGERWWEPWIAILERSAELPAVDDRAIIRDNRPAGWATLSLLVCVASVSASGIDIHYGELAEPGHWNTLALS